MGENRVCSEQGVRGEGGIEEGTQVTCSQGDDAALVETEEEPGKVKDGTCYV